MKLNLNNLDWDKATVLDGRYIYYLYLMCEERLSHAGIKRHISAQIFEPFGPFRYEEIKVIYDFTMYMARYVYLNNNVLNESNYSHGNLTRVLHFTSKDLFELTDFDFEFNPLIPGQLLSFYDKFLKPLYVILSQFKYLPVFNYKLTGSKLDINSLTIPKIEISNGEGGSAEFYLQGPDLQEWESDFKCIEDVINDPSLYSQNDNENVLGYVIKFDWHRYSWPGTYYPLPDETYNWTSFENIRWIRS